MGRPPKHTDVDEVGQSRPLELGEIGNPGPVEKVSETDFIDEAELEKFMNEILTVVVHENNDENAEDTPSVGVNGLNQYFIRGQEQKVKRKYVEVLAKTRITKYTQRTLDAQNPHKITNVPMTAIKDPFSVIHDPNPKGRAWLQAIKEQP